MKAFTEKDNKEKEIIHRMPDGNDIALGS